MKIQTMALVTSLILVSNVALSAPDLEHDVDNIQADLDKLVANSNAPKDPSVSNNTSSNSVNINQKRNPVSSAASTFLTSSDDTCMGSSGGGLQLVGVGISAASTWRDEECINRKNAKVLHDMGLTSAAVALMCQNANVWKAMKDGGTPCTTVDPTTILNTRKDQRLPNDTVITGPIVINDYNGKPQTNTCSPATVRKHHYVHNNPCNGKPAVKNLIVLKKPQSQD